MDPIATSLKQLPNEIVLCPLLLLVCFISFYLVFKLNRGAKDNIPPSPPRLPLIGHLHHLGALPHQSFTALSHKYGPIMLLHLGQTPTLVLSSAEVAREMVKTHDVVFASRSLNTAAKIFSYGGKNVGLAPYGEEWRQRRKVCTLELLSQKRVQSFQYIRDEEVADLVHNIRQACNTEDGSCVNLSHMLLAASNNIVCRSAFGCKYSSRDGNSKIGELARRLLALLTAFSVGDFIPSLSWLDVITGLAAEIKTTFSEIDALVDMIIAEHKKVKGDDEDFIRKDFVDILLQLQEGGNINFELTHETFKALLLDMFVAGTDTASATLEWAFAELLKNPLLLKKVQEEVRRVAGHKSQVHEDDVNQMNYLRCVINETFRLHPPAPLLVPRETTADVKLSGYDISAKTTVLVNVWAIHRDPAIWDRPLEFIPERFENRKIDYRGQYFEFTPFGIGRRGCPGISLGIVSVECILANLLYSFDWKLPRSGDLNMTEKYGLTVTKKVPLHVEAIPYSFGSNQ